MSRFVDALNEEIADLERRLEADPTYMKLREARRLLAVYASTNSEVLRPPLVIANPGYVYTKPAHLTQPKAPPASGMGAAALESAKRFLLNHSGPAPTMTLLDALAKEGITFGGKNPQNTLSSILSKSGDFKPNGRAGWTLVPPSGETKSADDTDPTKEASSADNLAPELLALLPSAQGREAGPGGGT